MRRRAAQESDEVIEAAAIGIRNDPVVHPGLGPVREVVTLLCAPIRGGVTHVDLQEVRLDRAIQASVSVELHGGEDAPGVREGGVLSQPLREVRVEALPLEVPEHLNLDVSGMEIGGTLRISDLTTPEGVTLLDDPEMVVATVTAPTKVVEPEPTEEELAALEAEAAEGEEGAEGEAAEASSEQEAEASGDESTDEG